MLIEYLQINQGTRMTDMRGFLNAPQVKGKNFMKFCIRLIWRPYAFLHLYYVDSVVSSRVKWCTLILPLRWKVAKNNRDKVLQLPPQNYVNYWIKVTHNILAGLFPPPILCLLIL